jgi:hypothetical protein
MLPLRDNVGEGGAPVSALVLIGLMTLAGFVVPGGGWLPALVALAAAWVFVPTPVRRFGLIPVAALSGACGALGGWLATVAGQDAGLWAAPAAAAGATGLHLLTNSDASVMGLVAIPFRSGFWEVPSKAFAACWAGAALILVVIL